MSFADFVIRPHRLPIHARGLHRDLRDPVSLQPVVQHQQPTDGRLELAHLLRPTAIRRRAPGTPKTDESG